MFFIKWVSQTRHVSSLSISDSIWKHSFLFIVFLMLYLFVISISSQFPLHPHRWPVWSCHPVCCKMCIKWSAFICVHLCKQNKHLCTNYFRDRKTLIWNRLCLICTHLCRPNERVHQHVLRLSTYSFDVWRNQHPRSRIPIETHGMYISETVCAQKFILPAQTQMFLHRIAIYGVPASCRCTVVMGTLSLNC